MLHQRGHGGWVLGGTCQTTSHTIAFLQILHTYPKPVAMLLKTDSAPCSAVRLTAQQALLAA